ATRARTPRVKKVSLGISAPNANPGRRFGTPQPREHGFTGSLALSGKLTLRARSTSRPPTIDQETRAKARSKVSKWKAKDGWHASRAIGPLASDRLPRRCDPPDFCRPPASP